MLWLYENAKAICECQLLYYQDCTSCGGTTSLDVGPFLFAALQASSTRVEALRGWYVRASRIECCGSVFFDMLYRLKK